MTPGPCSRQIPPGGICLAGFESPANLANMSSQNSRLLFQTANWLLAAASFLPLAFAGPVYADNAPEKLAKREHIQTFKEVTRRLNCFCGCHGLVSECLHVDEHCFAVQARRFIENRVLEEMSADQIVHGFVHGFGDRAVDDPILQQWAQKGRQDLIQGTIQGFGPSILHHEPPNWPVYLSLVSGLAVFALLLWHLWNTRIDQIHLSESRQANSDSAPNLIAHPEAARSSDSDPTSRFTATGSSETPRRPLASSSLPVGTTWPEDVTKALDDLER